MDLIIGGSGFVGSNFIRANPTVELISREALYGAKTAIECDRLIIAAPSAEKWKANMDPSSDWENITELTESVCSRFQPREILLFSTIDVYGSASNCDEQSQTRPDNPYGQHRSWLEKRLCDRFRNITVVRLPGLFGNGLKKNALYDITHNRVELISRLNPRSTFQWVPIDWAIKKSLEFMREGVEVVNLVSEPVPVEDLVFAEQSWKSHLSTANPLVSYSIRTIRADGDYFMRGKEVIRRIQVWSKECKR